MRLDALAADGTAPIQLTISWEGNRLRLGTGAMVRPEHWDGQQVKVQTGTPHTSVNPRLNRVTEAAAEAQQLVPSRAASCPRPS
ncbi:Arm DNA-binding domain-containing protein [Hymenobacter arcticus]